MITIYQLGPAWACIPSLGHYCIKVQTYCRMAGVPYALKAIDPRRAPNGKVPFIEDGGRIITDSERIVAHLEGKSETPLDASLADTHRASAHALRRMLEEHTYFTSVWFRWGEDRALPAIREYVRDAIGWKANLVVPLVRRAMQKQLWQQGIARHGSEAILARSKADMDVIESTLDGNRYLLGDAPTSIDASAYGILVSVYDTPWDAAEADYIRSLPRTADYIERIRSDYWSGWTPADERWSPAD